MSYAESNLRPAAMSIIATTFAEGPERNKALGIYTTMGASGFAVGAVVSGALTSALSWRWGFFDYVIIAALVLLLTPFLVAKSGRPNAPTRGFDLAGALSITAGLIVLVYAVGEANAVAVGQTLGLIALAILLLVVFVVIEARARMPLLPLGMFRSRTLANANLVALTFLAAFESLLFISALYLQNMLGYSPFQAGLVFVPLGIKPMLVLGMLLPAHRRDHPDRADLDRGDLLEHCVTLPGGRNRDGFRLPIHDDCSRDWRPGR